MHHDEYHNPICQKVGLNNWKLGCLSYFCELLEKMDLFLLQATPNVNSTANYLPIGIQLIFALAVVVGIILITHVLGPKRKTAEKLVNFESGIESQGNARQPMAIKYFLVAILFVLFDVEIIFFYPYAVNFRGLGWHGFMAVLMFVGFFLAGFIYIIKKGALKWEE